MLPLCVDVSQESTLIFAELLGFGVADTVLVEDVARRAVHIGSPALGTENWGERTYI